MLSSMEARDYLEEMMAEAIRENGALADPSIDAFIRALLAEDDAKMLMWELFSDVRMPAIRHLFGNMRYRAQKESGAFDSGARTASSAYPYPSGDGKSSHADSDIPTPVAAKPSPGSPSMSQTRSSLEPVAALSAAAKRAPSATVRVKPTSTMPAAPSQPPRGTEPPWSAVSASHAMYDRTFVNGKPIGDLTIEEALSVKMRNARLAKWIGLMTSQVLASQVPPTSKRRIREFIAEDESDKYYDMAKQEEDDAA